MTPHADDIVDDTTELRHAGPTRPPFSATPPRFIIIGAGSRGTQYAKSLGESTNGLCVAVCDPITYKARHLGDQYIWGKAGPARHQIFSGWQEFRSYEVGRRRREASGEAVELGVEGAFICVQDEMHKDVILGLAELELHVMCEKPLATRLEDCIEIYRSLLSPTGSGTPSRIFSIGHVLRYSPHNMLLRKLLLEDRVIGDIMSINHTEPVGWWHFSHSYVRGNWRREETSAPSLLTKSCHDIDFILWLLCSPPPGSAEPAHLPATVSSSGMLQYFHRARKPPQAKAATNCLSCDHEEACKYSAKKIYTSDRHKGLRTGDLQWPTHILVPDIEECIAEGGQEAGEQAILAKLAEDYPSTMPLADRLKKNWYGRCVYESDNDVCDDQSVTMTWDAEPHPSVDIHGENNTQVLRGRHAKLATFHMVAFTHKVCERFSTIYGTDGEIYADSQTIVVRDFNTGERRVHRPFLGEETGGHGGGDGGLARQFVLAVDGVKNHGMGVAQAQKEFVGCGIEEIVRSHALVFAAEEARTTKTVVDFRAWWEGKVLGRLG